MGRECLEEQEQDNPIVDQHRLTLPHQGTDVTDPQIPPLPDHDDVSVLYTKKEVTSEEQGVIEEENSHQT